MRRWALALLAYFIVVTGLPADEAQDLLHAVVPSLEKLQADVASSRLAILGISGEETAVVRK